MSSFEQNQSDAAGYLAQFSGGVLNHINGQQQAALDNTWFESLSPIDLNPLAKIAHGKAADIHLAAQAAHNAFTP